MRDEVPPGPRDEPTESLPVRLATIARLLAAEGERAAARAAHSAAGSLEHRLGRLIERDVDQFGFDENFTTGVVFPADRTLATRWFRTTTTGGAQLPDGPALLVANHAGTVPLDGPMVQLAVHDADPHRRVARMLAADRMYSTPILGDLSRRVGATLACRDDVDRLLAGGHLVLVFPEGYKGLGKPFRDRYRLQRFGRGGFVSAALRTRVPIVPITVVGSEEIYPKLGELPLVARLFSLPYFPITPTFPWLGPLGVIPLPSTWLIDIGEPIATADYPPAAADDGEIVRLITDKVRQAIQQRLSRLLAERGAAF